MNINKHINSIVSVARTICIAIVFAGAALMMNGCRDEAHDHASAEANAVTYTCPMHPQVVQETQGTCPICGMDLVLFDKSSAAGGLTLGASQQALANIKTMAAGSGDFNNFTRLNARLVTDPQQTNFVSSRVAGRIEKLYVKETGVQVSKGQALYQIYSEQLSTLQQEYLVMHAQAQSFPGDERFAQMEKAAKQKLLLYGQSESQIKSLVNQQKVSPYVTWFATHSGIVAELLVTEGQYVAEGGSIMRLESYDKLWVEADLYPAEADRVKKGQQLTVIVTGSEDKPQTMQVEFINPAIGSGTQMLQVRGTIPNPGNVWQAGMQAMVLLPSTVKQAELLLPIDAVIRSGDGAQVWVQTASGKYEPREVTLGEESFDKVEIKSGIRAGEQVVISGAYLLYSEYLLKK